MIILIMNSIEKTKLILIYQIMTVFIFLLLY